MDKQHFPAGRVRKRRMLVAAYKIMIILFLLVVISCQLGGGKIPPKLTGTWKTTNPRYAGRFMKITKNEIWLGIGENQVNKYAIKKIKKENKGYKIFFCVIQCKNNAGDQFNFSFIYDSANTTIKFAHQAGIWKKCN